MGNFFNFAIADESKYLNSDLIKNYLDDVGELKYANGNIYKGNFFNGLPNGSGKMIFPNGDFSEGIWKDNNLINGYYYNNETKKRSEIIDGVINEKPDFIKSVPIIKQLFGDCWAHSVSRNFVRTFQILNIIQTEHVESFYFLFYTILTNYKSCDMIGFYDVFAMIYLLDFLKKNYSNIFDITSVDNKCTKEYCTGGSIFNVDEITKSKIIEKFKYLFDKNLLFIGKYNYRVNSTGNNKPSDAIKKMLEFRLQPAVSVGLSTYVISEIKKKSFVLPTITDIDSYDSLCFSDSGHSVNLRRWTKSYIEFKNSWGNFSSNNGNFSVSDLKYLTCIKRDSHLSDLELIFCSLMFDCENMDPADKSEVDIKMQTYYKTIDDTIETENNKNYTGSYNSYGLFHGYGTYLLEDSIYYKGNWKNGLKYGLGIYKKNDIVYEGYWKDDKRNGKGIYSDKAGYTYEGDWVDDEKNGKGIYSDKFGNTYEGDWVDDKKNGSGVFKYNRIGIYDGQWKDDKKNGSGVFKYDDGGEYNGWWEDDKKNGKGTMTYADGSEYIGYWIDDVKAGYGIMTYADGSIYKGDWLNDKKNERGIEISKEGLQTEGLEDDNELAWPDLNYGDIVTTTKTKKPNADKLIEDDNELTWPDLNYGDIVTTTKTKKPNADKLIEDDPNSKKNKYIKYKVKYLQLKEIYNKK
jgi:hypothetical protein